MSCLISRAGDSDQDAEWFESQVRPLLAEHCMGCHSHRVGKTSGGLSLDSREDLLAGGDSGEVVDLKDADNSLLVSAIRRESIEMPPEKPLPPEQQAIIAQWIKRGAPWPKYDIDPNTPNAWLHERAAQHWAWKWGKAKHDEPSIATALHKRIDRMVVEQLEPLHVSASPRADAMVLLRRVYCDLIGLPPTLDQINSFNQLLSKNVSLDTAIENTIDDLLRSPQFGVHWGRHWLDLVRYTETMGHEFDFPIHNAWRYRDAVIKAINEDLPYDRFVQEHLAGDLMSDPRIDQESGINQSLVMTGWWWFGDSVQAPVDAKLDYAVRLDNQIDVFSKAFQGMTVACARCHDHKFDAISAADYYGVAGILRSSRRVIQPTDPHMAILKHNDELSQQIAQAEIELGQDATYRIHNELTAEAWLSELLQKLKNNADVVRSIDSPDHPLAWMLPLLKLDVTTSWQEFVETTNRLAEDHNAWLQNSNLIADFGQGLPKDWKLFGGFGYQQTAQRNFAWFSELPLTGNGNTCFQSDLLGRKQHVLLQSPDIEIKHKHLSLLGSGSESLSTIHVDGYYMQEFHQLLFADLRKGFPSATHQRWMSHGGDLNKYVGHRAYLSLDDTGNGWFNVQQIRSSDAPAPPAPADSNRFMATHDHTSAMETATAYLNRQLDAMQHGQCGDLDYLRCLNLLCAALDVKAPWELNEKAARLRQQIVLKEEATPAPTYLIAIADSTPIDAEIAIRGNPHTLGEVAPRGCFREVIQSPAIAPNSSGRLEMAMGMTTADHPLTSRVIVNRLWAKLLGTGLVASPDNFGVLGGRPSHPKLLDAMARNFTASGWSMKRLIREIMLTDTYQRSSDVSPDQQTLDPDGLKLTHRNIYRMPAESIRDSLLSFSASLNDQMYGVSVPIYLTDSMTGRGRPEKSGPLDGANRRTIFVEQRRNFLNPFLLAFDMPLPATTVGQRSRSNVPAQSLSMLNDPFVELTAQRWVEHHTALIEEASKHDDLLRKLFLTAFTREPDSDEANICKEGLRTHPNGELSSEAWTDLVMSILNSKEFLFIR